jgi:hypothetical protein
VSCDESQIPKVSSHSSAAPPFGSGQVMLLGQVFVPMSHAMSHWQELPHVMSSHAPSIPVHVAWHLPSPQLSGPHALLPPLHVSVHAPVPQVMLPHASVPSHVRVHAPLVQF